MKWIKNDQVFNQPESRYEVKTVDIAGNFWEYNAEKTFYQMLLGGVDFLLLGELNNRFYTHNFIYLIFFIGFRRIFGFHVDNFSKCYV